MQEKPHHSAFLVGQRVILRPVEASDAALMHKWMNDPEIRYLTGEVMPSTLADTEDYIQKLRGSSDRVWFIIALKETGRAIGETGLLRMFHPWRTTDLSIILGEKDAWSQGYGTEVINLMLDFAFGYLNFHRVSIGVVEFNEKALRFYEKIGFKKEGIQRDGYFYNHCYSDFVMMSILEEEF
ncbi:MAG: N-acetyltransferase, partial [Chloroflexi bacterium]